MFGGFEDGTKILPEPLLAEHIACNSGKGYAIITITFTVMPPERQYKWTGKDTSEFLALEKALNEDSLQSSGASLALEKAIEKIKPPTSKTGFSGRLRNHKREQERSSAGKGLKYEDTKAFATFIKAARYVRGVGAGRIHPRAKLRLFGLRMQAQKGDLVEGTRGSSVMATAGSQPSESSAPHSTVVSLSVQTSLRKLKLNAWRAEYGKDRKEAMHEYIRFLTSLVPNWRFDGILNKHKSPQKSRCMVWALKLHFTRCDVGEVLRVISSKDASPVLSRFRATSIEVLQSSDEATAKLFDEESEAQATHHQRDISMNDVKEDPFLVGAPRKLTLDDCLVDRIKHKTIEEQRAFFSKKMREMARQGFDDEDGWKLFDKTRSATVTDEYQLDVYCRKVEWSPSNQLRSALVADLNVDVIFDSLLHTFRDENIKRLAKDYSETQGIVKAAEGCQITPLSLVGSDSATALSYRIIKLPWPLTDR